MRDTDSFINEMDISAKRALSAFLKRDVSNMTYVFKTTVAGIEHNSEIRTSRDICSLLQNNTIVSVIEEVVEKKSKKKGKKSETEKERSKFIKKMGKRTSKKDKEKKEEPKKPKTECAICMERDADCVFIPCGHVCSCVQCGQNVKTCAVCRTPIVNFNKIFIM